MSHTETEIPTPETTHAHEPQVLKPERSRLGLMRPDHGKSVIIDWLTTVDHKKSASCMARLRYFSYLLGASKRSLSAPNWLFRKMI